MAQKKKTIEDLNRLYFDGQSADQAIFAEQRSNVMLIAGNHYSGKGARDWSRIREARDLPSEQKIRLTKNHIQKITKTYLNNIVSCVPGVQIAARNERDNQDRKCAELNQSVWQYGKESLGLDLKIMSWAKDFIDMGECANKVFWNPDAGEFMGYSQKVDELGQGVLDESGQPAADETKPVFGGQLQIEKILPTNLLRDASATSMEDSPVLMVRKMLPDEDAKALVHNDPAKLKFIQEASRDEYMVFDMNQNGYSMMKGQVLIIEYYFKPCAIYPMGYYYITTKQGILFEGELPFGIYPINYAGFDESQTSPRHKSIVKQLRPYQMEINRTASKIAEHQVTSDDKILIQSGTKIASGGVLPGVRAIQYSGAPPTVLEGRAGAQYVDYMNSQIAEMYQVSNVTEDSERKDTGADPYGMLFRSVRDQKKFSIYGQKFEGYLKSTCMTYLRLAKKYLPDTQLIPAIGKSEYVNISEFRSAQDVRMQIKAMPMTDDINSMFGKWLAINHTIQYVGTQLGKEDIGRLLRNVPYGNFEESFSDMTLDYDLGTNYLLALDRGEWIEPSSVDNKSYMAKRIEKRMRDSDFKLLDKKIQQMYTTAKQMYEQLEIDEKLAIQRAEQGFIPTGGPLIKTDLQVNLPNTTGGLKTTRAAFPVEALSWLQKQLEVQGSNLQDLAGLDQATQASMANKFTQQSQASNQMNPNTGETTITGPTQGQGAQNGGFGANQSQQYGG